MSGKRDIVLGIDFGTSYSSAGVMIDGKVQFVLDDGEAAIPTVVHIPQRGDPLVGARAIARQAFEPSATAASFKRILGRTPDDPAVRRFQQGVPYRVAKGAGNKVMCQLRGSDYTCEQLAAIVLRYLRDLAEQRFGGTVRGAVVTVPVAMAPGYVEALKTAAKLAGIELKQVVHEPVAGALAARLPAPAQPRRLLVCDFGGGTFDATLMSHEGGQLRCLAADGDEFLGGDDFDDALAAGVVSAIFKRAAFDMQKDAVRSMALVRRCESVKRMLSTRAQAPLAMKDAYLQEGERVDLNVIIERDWAEGRWSDLIGRGVAVVGRLMARGGWTPDMIDDVVMLGGTCLIPAVRRTLAAPFEGARQADADHAHLAIAGGAILLAGATQGQRPADVAALVDGAA